MPARVPVGRLLARSCAVSLFLISVASAQINLGLNPIVATNASLTLGLLDTFTGTLTVGTAGQSNGALLLAADYSTGLSLVFTGNNSLLSHSISTRTLTLTSAAALTRTGTGSTNFQEIINNSGAFTVNGGTLTANAAFTNQSGGTVTVTGAGSILNLTTFANAGSFISDNSGQLRLTGAFTTANLGAVTITNGGKVEFANGSTLTNTALSAPTAGSYLFNGLISGGTIAAAALTQSSGTLDNNATINGSFTVPSNTQLTIKNGGGWTGGTATIGTLGQSNGQLFLGTDSTVSAGLTFTGNNSLLSHSNTVHTLTLASTATFTRTGAGSTNFQEIIDNSGAFTVNGGTLTANAAFTNQPSGVVTVTGAGSIFNLTTFANSGSFISDSAGQLRLTGAFTTANLGSIAITNGGVVEFANGSTLTNTALSAPSGGSYLFNGLISGGTIAAAALTQSSGTLDNNATINGSFTVPSNTQLTIKNGGGWIGGTATIGTLGQSNGQLFLGTDSTVSAGLTFTGNNSLLSHSNTTHTLTLASTATFLRTGAGSTNFQEILDNSGAFMVNGGTLTANAAFTNQPSGVVTVTGAGSIFNLTTFANSGSFISDSAGQLRLTGAFTTANLGSIAITNGGVVEFANGSTLTNTALSAPSGGSYLFNGLISGGTIAAAALTQSSGTLDNNATINGSFTVPSNTQLTIKNGGGWIGGTATVGTLGQSNGQLFLGTDSTVSAGLTFTGNNSLLSHSNTVHTLTLASTATFTRTGAGSTNFQEIIDNSGAFTVNGGTLTANAAFTNQPSGVVTVTGAGSIFNLTTFANSGSFISDSAGQLRLTGAFTTANLGSIAITNGGVVEFANGSALTNTSLSAPTGGSYLFNGLISGGTIAAAALTQSSGTLDNNATINGSFTVPSNTQLTIKNGGGWTGGTATVGTLGQSNGQLFLGTDSTVSAGLTFTGNNSLLSHSNSTHTLTLAPTGTLARTGAGSTSFQENIDNNGAVSVNGGSLSSSGTFTNRSGATVTVSAGASFSQTGAFTNSAGATATVTGASSTFAIANVANAGSLVSDTNGVLSLTGAFTTAGLGSIALTNSGTVELAANGTLNNASANLLPPTGGTFLFKGTILGGTIDPLALTQNAGTLDAALISGNLAVPNGTSLTLKNNGGWTGTATVGVVGQNGGQLFLATDDTLSSALVFTGSNSLLSHSSSTRNLSITSSGTLTRTGAGSTSMQENLLNAGAVAVNGGSVSSAGTFTNQSGGTVNVSGGASFTQTGTFSNNSGATASVTGASSTLAIANVVNAGSLLSSSSGLLSLTGSFTTANLGSITLSGGAVELAASSLLTNSTANLLPPTGGTFLFKGTILGGTIDPLALTQNAGTLDAALISGNLAVPNGTSLTLKNNGGWTGTATVGVVGQNGGQLFLATDDTLSTALVFTGSNSLLSHSSSTRNLSITSSGTLTRTGAGSTSMQENLLNAGVVAVNGGSVSSAGTFTNQSGGTVNVSGGASFTQTGTFTNQSGATATVTGLNSTLAVANVANAGALVSDANGLLSLTGSFTTAGLGSIALTNSGTVELASNAILTNTAANLLPPTGGRFIFKGTITGGTVDPLALTENAGTLDAASITGSIAVPNGTSLTLKNNGGWTGTATVGVVGQNGGQLFLATDDTLSSALVFTGSNSLLSHSSSTRNLSITSSGTLTRTGAGSTSMQENLLNAGVVAVNGGSVSSAGTFTNQSGGTVNVSGGASFTQTGTFSNNSGATAAVTGAGSSLALANLINAGALTADTGGLLSLTGAFTTAGLGSITLANGGLVELASNALLTNTAGNLLPPTGGSYLFKGTIIGGTIDPLALTQNAGTLDGAQIAGNVAVPNGTSLTVKNGGGWSGTATVGVVGQNGGQIFLATDATLNSAVVFTGSNSLVSHTSSTRTVTISPIGSVTRTGAGSTSSQENILNSGAFTVNGGSLSSSGSFTNQAGGFVDIGSGASFTQSSNPFVQTGGLLKVNAGGTFSPGTAGLSIQGGSVTGDGAINGNATITSGTLDPGAPIGTLTFAGNLTLTGGAVTNIELGAGVNDRVTVSGGGNSLVFGGTLNILAVSTAFASGQTWTVFSFPAHSGTFATINLPFTGSGWVWDTSQLTTTGALTLTTFVPVPEPSTYALLAAGLGMVFLVRRRSSSRRS